METDHKKYRILVIEDNPGDFALVEEFLLEKIDAPGIIHAKNYKEAKEALEFDAEKFDIVLLDISLPDKVGVPLILEIIEICLKTPVIVLTGYADFEFGVKSLSLGISDYILKDELSPIALYRSIMYNIERQKIMKALEESEKKYSGLFHLSPLPMWVVDIQSLCFLDVNIATINHYGYSRDEFLSMTLNDIKSAEEVSSVSSGPDDDPAMLGDPSRHIVVHKLKNGYLRQVELDIAPIEYKGINANIVIATDITDRLNYIKAIEEQNQKLKDISWLQSHVVRAPLARIMGLAELLKDYRGNQEDLKTTLEYLLNSTNELDNVIRNITDKTHPVSYTCNEK